MALIGNYIHRVNVIKGSLYSRVYGSVYRKARTGYSSLLSKYVSLRNEVVHLLRQSKNNHLKRMSKLGSKQFWKTIKYMKKTSTVDLEIFVVKIFSWFAQTTKIKKHEIYCTTDNHYSKNIFVRNFTAHC